MTSLNLLTFFVLCLVILLLTIIAIVFRQFALWRRLPIVDEYIKKHPQALINNKYLSCCYCGSSNIKNWGLFGASDLYRVFVCNYCGNILYRNRGPKFRA